MAGVLWLNDVDAETLGLIVSAAPDLLGAASRAPLTLGMPQFDGVLLGTTRARAAERRLRIAGEVNGNMSLSAANTMVDRVKSAVGDGLVEIRSVWDTTRAWRGVLTDAPGGPTERAWLGRSAMELEFLLADPYAWDTATRDVGLGASLTAIPLGTAPSRGREWWSALITIAGPATTPTLVYADSGRNTISTMAFTWSPTLNDRIEIDLGRGTIVRVQSGTRDNGYSYVTAGFEFPALDPADGDYYTSAFPMLSVSSGTGSVRYARSWK